MKSVVMTGQEGEKTEDALAPQDLGRRTTDFALRVIRMYSALPRNRVAQVLGDQALRAGTSVGGQYREGHRARSDAEVISKMESVLQELDETTYWLELLAESKTVSAKRLSALRDEANQLTAIFVTIVRKVKARKKRASK